MSTDIAVPAPTPTDLTSFVWQAQKVYEISKALANTAFVPVSMRGKPQEITGCILFGQELGMGPMTSLRTVDIIQGRPTLTANGMRGLAMKAGVRFRLDESTETRCVMSALPPGAQSWTTITWTLDQAKRLGLTSKENWKNQPGVMLIARATSQLCRLVAANVLIGATYSVEEMTDVPVNDPPPAKKVEQVAKWEEPDLVPDHLPQEPENVGPIDVNEKITSKTRAAVMAAFNEAGITDRTKRNEKLSMMLGREVSTVNNITEGEGRAALDLMSRDSDWPPVAGVEAP